MNIRSLQTFIRVVELKSFTKAACELNYVQSTVTMQIQQLEKELGYPLFDRIGKKIALTSYGENFFIYANEVLQIMQRVNNVGKNPEEMKGTLRIGLLESLLSGTTQHIFPLFKAHYKNIEVHLKMGQLYELLPLLRQGQLDMLYISGELNMDPDFHCCYKRKENLVFISAPDHPLAGEHGVSLENVLSYPFIVTELSGTCYGRLNQLAFSHNQSLQHPLIVDSTIAIAELVSRGMGIAFLPEYSVSDYIKQQRLAQISVNIPPQIYYSQILHCKDKWIPPFMNEWISLIHEYRPER